MIPYFDWIIGASTIASIALLSKKRWEGWLLAVFNNSVMFPMLNVHNHNYGLLPLDVVTVALSLHALLTWKVQAQWAATTGKGEQG